jgi:perosamine synthetase
VPGLQLNVEPPGYFNTFWMVNVVLDESYGLGTQELMQRFDEAGIDTRPFFHPLSLLPAFSETPEARTAKQRNRVAYSQSPRGLNLPCAMKLEEPDVDRVCATLRSILGGART